jgi:hypothetical protein
MADRKPILCLDFDGVLHSYKSGWQGATVIPDPPVDGAAEFLRRAVEAFDVEVHSSRSGEESGPAAMRFWLWKVLRDGGMLPDAATEMVGQRIAFPRHKPPAFVTLDDRAVTFTGQWPTIEELLAFEPWWKGGRS